MNITAETILIYTIVAGLLSIVYGYLTGKNILSSSAGNPKCKTLLQLFKLEQKHT